MLTGAGIGGEYSAVQFHDSRVDPGALSCWTDLAINGSFGSAARWEAAGSIILLDPTRLDPDIGWRLAFLIGSALGLVIFFLRTWIPESPRWLVIHRGRRKPKK